MAVTRAEGYKFVKGVQTWGIGIQLLDRVPPKLGQVKAIRLRQAQTSFHQFR
jgi:hypothetical protein